MALNPKSPSIVSDALTMFNHAKDKRRTLVGKWTTNYHIVHNRTWGAGRPAGHPRTEIPEIYPILASIVAWETDMTPQFKIAPNVPPFSPYAAMYDDLAADLEWILNTNWETLDYDMEVSQILWDGEVYGIGYGKAVWDAPSSGGLGDVYLRRVDPFCVYLDPDARSWKDISYIFETKSISKDELKRRFPKADLSNTNFRLMDAPEAPTQLDSQGGYGRNTIRPNPGSLPKPGGGTNVTSFGGGSKVNATVIDDSVTLVELWYRTIEKSDLGEPEIPDPTPKTPNRSEYKDEWRCLIFCGDQILMDKSATDIFGHGRHPYSRYVPLEEGELYGYSLVEQLAPMQISINRLFAAVEHNAWLSGNPILIKRQGDRQTLTNRPGEVFDAQDPNSDVRWLVPPPISPSHITVIDRIIAEMERVSGMSAIVRGSQPQGRPSEGLMNTVQDSAFVRIRQRLRNFERFLREAGFLLASMVAEFYDTQRILSRVGNDDQSTALALSNQHFFTPTKDGLEPLRFNIAVRAGAFGAIGREARASMYERFFAMGAIDSAALLQLTGVPNWKDISDRVQSQQQMAGTLGMPPTQRAAARR